MDSGLDSLTPFRERGASNGGMCFLKKRKVQDCQLWDACCQGGFWILRGQKGKSVLLKTTFSAEHLISITEKKKIQHTAGVIALRGTFVLLMKVRKKKRKVTDGKKGAAPSKYLHSMHSATIFKDLLWLCNTSLKKKCTCVLLLVCV